MDSFSGERENSFVHHYNARSLNGELTEARLSIRQNGRSVKQETCHLRY